MDRRCKKMDLDIKKVTQLGWEPKMNSKSAVENACREIISDLK
jgi:nucleoside-diphosphate-sugar epimerase